MAIQMQTQSFRLDESDPRYRCCCGCCHSKTGTLAIGIVSTVLYAGSLIKSVAQLVIYNSACRDLFDETDCQNTGSGANFSGNIVGNAIWLFCAILLIVGAQKRSPGCLIPFMVVTALSMIAICVLATYAIVDGPKVIDALAQNQGSTDVDPSTTGLGAFIGIVLVICAIAMAFEIWFMVVVVLCYRYLKASSVAYGGYVQGVAYQQQELGKPAGGYPQQGGNVPPAPGYYPQGTYPPPQPYAYAPPTQGYAPPPQNYPPPPKYPSNETYQPEKQSLYPNLR